MRDICTFIVAVNTLICSAIWTPSSLVGVKIKQNIPYGSFDRSWIIGNAKAAVLPEPVWAPPITCFPERIAGIASDWISVGCSIPTSLAAFANHGNIPSFVKLLYIRILLIYVFSVLNKEF